MEQKLGVLGGMGPQATQVFYQFVLDRTDAARDQEHLPALILSDTGMPDRTSAILSGDTGALYARLLGDAKLLEGCGCTAIAIPCNTSHYFADRLQSELRVPIVHMIRETAKALRDQGKKRPAVLATDCTIRTGLYQKECAALG
ncbi:MAG: amino acid racemase, partial [Oscillospiraceae bacterium]|nr:amino acid racemase [Oscillospiraceae bacterium]